MEEMRRVLFIAGGLAVSSMACGGAAFSNSASADADLPDQPGAQQPDATSPIMDRRKASHWRDDRRRRIGRFDRQ